MGPDSGRHGAWMTWPEAAELVGCPVPTIDWHQRSGRIESRPHHGSRPTLRRESVEEFARWYADRAARRQEPQQRPDDPPDSTGWLDTRQAADRLGRVRANIAYLVRSGQLDGVRRGRRLWVREADLQALLEAREHWMSLVDAARLAGCSPRTMQRAAERGEIQRREAHRARPSLSREAVLAWAAQRREPHTPSTRSRAARDLKIVPPDDQHEWLRADAVAELLGVSPGRVRQLAATDRLPSTRIGEWWWFRRDLVKQTAAARAFQSTAGGG